MSEHRIEQRLALQGGQKAVSGMQGKGKPKIGVDEFMSVAERFGLPSAALRSIRAILAAEDLGGGAYLANYYSGLAESKVQAFERTALERFGVKYSLGVSSGTGALHSAFVAAGVGPGTEVICPALGFFATASAVVTANGVPVFCDVDESLHIDPAKIEGLVTPRTVAIAPTSVMGGVCDMAPIMKIARKHNLAVVEDCAQSCGATYRGKLVGTIGDLGCFSISAYKIVGGGEGGLMITNKKRLWERASQVAESGGLWRPDRFAAPRYEGELFCGTNYRMSELEAAVDVVQLRKMPATVKRFQSVRRRIAKQLRSYAEITPQRLNDPEGTIGYLLRFFPQTLGLSEEIVAALQAEGLECTTRGKSGSPDWHIYHYMYPIHGAATDQACSHFCAKYTDRTGPKTYHRGACPVADDLFDRCVTVPLNQWYNAKDCREVAAAINKVLSAYCTEDSSAPPWPA